MQSIWNKLTYVATDRLAKVSHLRSAATVDKSGKPALLSDISVDADEAAELVTSPFVASVDLRMPEHTWPHRGTREYVKRHLEGRNPVVFAEDGYLRVAFAVPNLEPQTVATVKAFASDLGALLNTETIDCRTFRLPA